MQLKTCFQSSPNIALIKYWGKYHEGYILPINDSIGLTLHPKDFHTKTTITFSPTHPTDTLVLNGKQHPQSQRLKKVFRIIREKVYPKFQQISPEDWQKHHFYIQSTNSFPTASGMASSASGLACLAAALNHLFGNVLSQVQLSELARFGSGSASRSVFGGLVRWKGVPRELLFSPDKPSEEELNKLSKRCISFSTREAESLSYIKIICLLATNKEKQTSSTKGMKLSVETSQLIKYRNQIADKRIQILEDCIDKVKTARQEHNKESEYTSFNLLCETIIKDSNQFHAICLDTYPPIFYLNEFSKQVIEIVDQYINPNSKLKMAYTFDAGPHAFLFVHEDKLCEVFSYLMRTFQVDEEQMNEKAKKIRKMAENKNVHPEFPAYKKETQKPYALWTTQVGPGAKLYEL